MRRGYAGEVERLEWDSVAHGEQRPCSSPPGFESCFCCSLCCAVSHQTFLCLNVLTGNENIKVCISLEAMRRAKCTCQSVIEWCSSTWRLLLWVRAGWLAEPLGDNVRG